MERDLKNKVAVVTGGAVGIGYQIANFFLKHEAKTIIILDIMEIAGDAAAKTLNDIYGPGKAVFMKCDVVTDLEPVSKEILQKYRVDILVNNAGILDESSLRRTIEINTIALVEWGMKFWDYMRKDNGGSGGTIVNVASIYGFVYDPYLIYYKTSKHAVIGFTKTLGHAQNYEKTGVRVIAICPGFTDTKILKGNLSDYEREDMTKFIEQQIIQKVETVGQAAVDIFKVADSGSAWVTKNEQPIEPAPI